MRLKARCCCCQYEWEVEKENATGQSCSACASSLYVVLDAETNKVVHVDKEEKKTETAE